MLRLILNGEEWFDDTTNTFSYLEDSVEINLEHSLLSLSKWESFFEKSFLGTPEKTDDETLFYVFCMIVGETHDPTIMQKLSNENIKAVNDYINSTQSATTFGEMPKTPGRGEIITAELIYYWMVAFNIPFECESWHLNRLFSLIKICNIKNSKPQKMSRAEMAKRNHALNAQRREQLNTTG